MDRGLSKLSLVLCYSVCPIYPISTCLGVYRCLPGRLSIHLFSYLSIPIFISIYIGLSIPFYSYLYLAIYLFTYLSIYLSTYLPTYLSIYLSAYAYRALWVELVMCASEAPLATGQGRSAAVGRSQLQWVSVPQGLTFIRVEVLLQHSIVYCVLCDCEQRNQMDSGFNVGSSFACGIAHDRFQSFLKILLSQGGCLCGL